MNINKWNNDVLSAKGIKHKAIAPKVVRVLGDAKKTTLENGTVVERVDYIWCGEAYGLVKCCPYSVHFIYEVKDVQKKGWAYYCTCGSISGVVGFAAYSKLASPTSTGYMLVCVRHQATKNNVGIGFHADGVSE